VVLVPVHRRPADVANLLLGMHLATTTLGCHPHGTVTMRMPWRWLTLVLEDGGMIHLGACLWRGDCVHGRHWRPLYSALYAPTTRPCTYTINMLSLARYSATCCSIQD